MARRVSPFGASVELPALSAEDEIRLTVANLLRTFHAKLAEDLPDQHRILPGASR